MTGPRQPDRAGGVLSVGLADVTPPFRSALANHYREMAGYRAQYLLGYTPGRKFRRFSDSGTRLLLAPHALPLPLRVPVFAVWVLIIAFWLGLTRRVTVFSAQSPYEGLLLWAARAALRMGGVRVALVVQLHGLLSEVGPMVHASLRYTGWFWRPPTRWVLGRADAVRVVSDSTAAHARAAGAKHIVAFPVWNDWELFFASPRGTAQRSHGSPRIAFVGTLTPVKGVDTLVEAIAELRRRGHDVRVTIAGDGPQWPEYEALAERLGVAGQIEWAGHVASERVKEILDDAYVLVSPSRSEGLARVLIEAAACSLPVVATNVGGTPEAVEDGTTGLLVPPDDPNAIASAVARLINDRPLARRLGEEGYRAAQGAYSSEAWMDAYRTLIDGAEDRRLRRTSH